MIGNTLRASSVGTMGEKLMARTATKKSTARRGRKTTSTRARRTTKAAPAAVRPAAPAASRGGGISDLAGGLRTLLDSIETEVRAVTGLSERIDRLVNELNACRDEQAARLTALDTLRGSVNDAGLGSFLDKAIKPRRTRVAEVIPGRLSDWASVTTAK